MKCLQCGEEIVLPTSWQKFCCKKCRDTYSRKLDQFKLKPARCAQCGKYFTPRNSYHRFCCEQCRRDSDNGKKCSTRETTVKKLEDWVREARECNLDYGNYRALIESGKTFEELKATANTRSAGEHAHKPYRFI